MDTENLQSKEYVRTTTKSSTVPEKETGDNAKSSADERQVISESFKNLHVTEPTNCVNEAHSDSADSKEFDNKVILESIKETSTSIRHKRKHKNKRKKSELDACSSSSSYTDSVGFRTRQSIRSQNFPPLITLSSDSGSDSNSKRFLDPDNEDIKRLLGAENIKGKRFAHVKADYFRKLASVRWSERRRCGNYSETSSNNSVIAKVKKRAKKRSLVSKAVLAQKKYFAQKSLRHSQCLATRNKLRQPFLRARAAHHHQRADLSVRGRHLRKLGHSGLRNRQAGRSHLAQSSETSSLHLSPKPSSQVLPDGTVPIKRPKGRPRKYFKVETMPAAESLKQNNEGEKKNEDENSNDESSQKDVMSTVSEQGENSEASVTIRPPMVVRKRGRAKMTMSSRVTSDRNIHINRKIKPFLQKTSCIEITQRIAKCRECRLATYYKGKNQSSYCRFLEFRKLCYAKNGAILNAGFSQAIDCTEEDRRLWLPRVEQPPLDLSIETSKALLVQVGDQFCDLIEHEKEAPSLHIGSDKTLTWKKIVQGVREMCDVCDTTLFNIHWVCPKCGLAVCIDCYKVRKQGIVNETEEGLLKGRDEYLWLLCNGRQPHEQDKLIMTQIIPGNVLWTMQTAMHRARDIWEIASYCKCHPHVNQSEMSKHVPTGICKQLMSSVSKSFSSHPTMQPMHVPDVSQNRELSKLDTEIGDSALKWLNNEKYMLTTDNILDSDHCNSNDDMIFGPCYESFASLKNMLLQGDQEPSLQLCPASLMSYTIDDIITTVIETKVEKSKCKEKDAIRLFNHRYPQPNSGRDPLPIRIFTTTESSIIHNDVPHSWLCNGRLLLLHQAMHNKNLELFQEQWKRGQPIMVMGVDKRLDMTLWHPDGFCRDFGEIKNDLVNCKTGAIIPDLPMKKFWEGFENFDKRLKDDNGDYILLKLKDWPPGEDFSEKLPKRFNDLMKGLPLPEYTHRDGIFNLAGRLPTWFVRPDLGPKMYNAYGSALYPTKGTTNLHLDMSDAVNVMVYVGVPPDDDNDEHVKEALKAIDEGGCDSLMRARVRSKGVRPGALWHIYNARDTDKIRDMLTKVAIERGEKLEANHDPIHDQSWYIDAELRKRLYHEYGVEGYAIAQCLGDAVFIPAGAPHQVRNLHSCVKVAEDFVSPENIGHCFKLTQEFRHLSDTHTNHEDKLQIKNIIYHVVKDSLSHLLDSENYLKVCHLYNVVA